MILGVRDIEDDGCAFVIVGDVVVVLGQPPSIQAVRTAELVTELLQEIVLPCSLVQPDVTVEVGTGVKVIFVGHAM
jgi:hypothetical protein